MITDSCSFILLVAGLGWLAWIWRRRRPLHARPPSARAPYQRLLTPRTPEDCPACRWPTSHRSPAPRPAVQPWRAVKSRRGAPKRIITEGFACPRATCSYYRIPDAGVHALVGYGAQGKTDRIQRFRCQACGMTFSARRDTPLYHLKTAPQQIVPVLTAIAEGLTIAAAGRVFGHSEHTIATWLTRAGAHSATLHDRWFRQLYLPYVQLDELRTRLRCRAQGRWLWVVIDPVSKLIPVLHLGGRTQDAAHRVIHELHQRLAPSCLPVCTSDGLNHYFYALTAHFGHWMEAGGQRKRQWHVTTGLLYGQVKKTYRQRKVVRVTQVVRCGTRQQLSAVLQTLGFSGRLNTAFVERANLTVRRSVAGLARRTWATAQEAPHLLAQLEWWRGYYHFVRPHETLRRPLDQPSQRRGRRLPRHYYHRTPAMAAGLTRRRWTVRELLALPLPPDPLAG